MRRGALVLTAATVAVVLLAGPASAAPGDLDPTYGNGGVRAMPFGAASSFTEDLALMPDGGVVLAGAVDTGGGAEPALARLTKDGRPNRAFGTNGRLVHGTSSPAPHERFVAVEAQGKDILALAADTFGEPTSDFQVLRFDPTGTLDTTFGVGGVARADFGGWDDPRDMVVMPDGRFVVVGTNQDDRVFAVARFTADGILDPTFGNNGRRRVVFPSAAARAVTLRPGGFAVVGTTFNGVDSDWAIAALTNTGGLDPSFDDDGRLIVERPDSGSGQAITVKQGKLIVAGAEVESPGGFEFAVRRINPDGSVDPLFGDQGLAIVPVSTSDDIVREVRVLSTGRLVLTGFVDAGGMPVVRLTAGGDPDPSFGGGDGVVLYEALGIGSGMVIDAAGRAVISTGQNNSMAAARVLM